MLNTFIMKNFVKWCNKNSGFLTFLASVVGFAGIIISIILKSETTKSNNTVGIIGKLFKFLGQNVNIPLYVLIVLLIVLVVVIILFARNRKKNSSKIDSPKHFRIISDENTVFLKSETYPNWKRSTFEIPKYPIFPQVSKE